MDRRSCESANSRAFARNWRKCRSVIARLVEETDALRAFAAAIPQPVWARRANGTLSFANAAYARAAEAANPVEAVEHNLELLDSADRADMARALAQGQTFSARVPVAIGGRRRFFDICALNVSDGSAGIAIDSSEATELTAALVRMADAHRRMLDQLSRALRCSTPAST